MITSILRHFEKLRSYLESHAPTHQGAVLELDEEFKETKNFVDFLHDDVYDYEYVHDYVYDQQQHDQYQSQHQHYHCHCYHYYDYRYYHFH